MAPLASNQELADSLQTTTVVAASATLALAIASSDIRTHCGWSISEETVTAVLDGSGRRTMWLPTLKLTAVASVTVDGTPLVVGTDFDWTSYGKLIRRGCWPHTARSVTITYTHGYSPVPDVVKGACLAIAGGYYDNPQLLKARSEAFGPFSESVTLGEPRAALAALGKFVIEELG